MKTEAGKEIIFRLVRRSDVVVENFRPRVKHRLGIDYETLKKINPRIVYTSISGFGQDGPYADHAGLDQIAQGLSGFMTVNGFPEHGPAAGGAADRRPDGRHHGGVRHGLRAARARALRARASGSTPRCSRG